MGEGADGAQPQAVAYRCMVSTVVVIDLRVEARSAVVAYTKRHTKSVHAGGKTQAQISGVRDELRNCSGCLLSIAVEATSPHTAACKTQRLHNDSNPPRSLCTRCRFGGLRAMCASLRA